MAFGVIVFDQDYEDTGATCLNLNSMVPYSRFQTSSTPASSTCAYQNYYAYKLGGVLKPDFFSSLGHQLRDDLLRSSCVVTPPTIFEKPEWLVDTLDLHGAARAVASVTSQADCPPLSLSIVAEFSFRLTADFGGQDVFSEWEKGATSWSATHRPSS
ncbi:hypothetical protein MRX96_028710 [Rhipicephalus microplus]